MPLDPDTPPDLVVVSSVFIDQTGGRELQQQGVALHRPELIAMPQARASGFPLAGGEAAQKRCNH